MPTDHELYIEHIVTQESYITLAEKYGLSADSVRSRLSRASRVPLIVAEAMAALGNKPLLNPPGREVQERIIKISQDTFNTHMRMDRIQGGTRTLMWIGDMHIPYQRKDALNLTYQILSDVKPNYVTGLNDLFDFRQYGRWDNVQTAAAQLWESDIWNALGMARLHHQTIRRLSPTTVILGLESNHTKRIFDYLRRLAGGFDETNIGEYVTALFEQGCLVFTTDTGKENTIKLSYGLKLVHGISAAKADSTVAKETIEALRGRDGTDEEGIFYHTHAGHVHRDFTHNYLGVSHTNFGCLCHTNPEYTSRETQWHLGVGLTEYDPGGRTVHPQIIRFREEGNKLTARLNGRKYETELVE